ncbi:Lrp/AsnC family transcriptional regulator [Paracoccus thiocyanatus]|uniref:Transcriptional regulator n=1 Tax=Paracoccus thiocyanatus TaxID=34006 RepID=A0A1N6PUY9_9RHOB|nr:Lrp/AsnC family transcriptional regulator [Paracoccus thiocyanatus]RDW14667.1 transcriptional regulator [Paracoccus thiocyanatus]SIQ08174.1 transcriptional regulator, AsnC family [Paracoccus thiocyanatus]
MVLDEIDRRILEALRRNARASHVELAAQVGLSASACARRIRILEHEGVIRGYTTIRDVSAAKARRPVFIQVKLATPNAESMRKFENAARKCEEVRECFLMTGEADYLLRIEIDGLDDFESVHAEVLSRLPGVSGMLSSFTIRSVFSYL